MKLLLIDSRINEHQVFIDSRKDDVTYKVFDYLTDTYESLLSCEELLQGQFTDIALVQHTDMIVGIKMLEQEPRCDSYDSAPYSSFDRLRSFLKDLKDKHGLQRFDFLGCAMYDAQVMPQIFSALEGDLGIDLRASTNFTGNAPDGDWILESDNVDVRDKYFSEAIQEWKGTLGAYSASAGDSLALLTTDTSSNIFVYGDALIAGGTPYNLNNISISGIYGNKNAYAAIDTSGRVWAWGPLLNGGTASGSASTPFNMTNIKATSIISNPFGGNAFTAIDSSGKVWTWGPTTAGGAGPGSAATPSGMTNIQVASCVATANAFAAIDSSNRVWAWGNIVQGGAGANTTTAATPSGMTNIQVASCVATANAFAAIDSSGRVWAWGTINAGGAGANATTAAIPTGMTNIQVTSVVGHGAGAAFAAIDSSGRVWAWGSTTQGGAGANATTAATPSGMTNIKVTSVVTNANAFAALDSSGRVWAWGNITRGGAGANAQTAATPSGMTNIKCSRIISNGLSYALAAIDTSGRVWAWGNITNGGAGANATTAATPSGMENIQVTDVFGNGNNGAAAAIDTSGRVWTWGHTSQGGTGANATTAGTPAGMQNIKITTIMGDKGGCTFAAIDTSGYIWSWGNTLQGGIGENATSAGCISHLKAKSIISNTQSYSIVSQDNIVYAWGSTSYGGVSYLNALSKIYTKQEIVKVISNSRSYTILTNDTSNNVYSFGKYATGGSLVHNVVSGLENKNISDIFSNRNGSAFAAIDTSGYVYAWGSTTKGGAGANTREAATPSGMTNIQVTSVVAAPNAFAAIDSSGRVWAWGSTSQGGAGANAQTAAIPLGMENIQVTSVVSNANVFAAIDTSGRVWAWGAITQGGAGAGPGSAAIPSGMENIQVSSVVAGCNAVAFAAIDSSGRVWAWGNITNGGVGANAKTAAIPLGMENIQVTSVVANITAFAAIDSSGRVWAWGSTTEGGAGPNPITAATPSGMTNIQVTSVVGNSDCGYGDCYAFTAIDSSGRVWAWGNTSRGGAGANTREAATPSGMTNIQVTSVVGNADAFVAIDSSGRVWAWGAITYGGAGANTREAATPSGITNISIKEIKATTNNFHAIGYDNTVYTWGSTSYFNIRPNAQTAVADTALMSYTLKSTTTESTPTPTPTPAPSTVPDAPTSVSATRGNGQATVSFTAPENDGGATITTYTVISSDGQVATGSSSPITVTGLTNGTSYTFRVKAYNSVGFGPLSTASSSVTPATVPGAPTISGVTVGVSQQATIAITAPASNGGSAILRYIVTVSGQPITVSGASPITVTGLTNGQQYTFILTALNAIGESAQAVSSQVTVDRIPDAPTIMTAIPGNGQAIVSFMTPALNGSSTITGYQVTSNPGGYTKLGASSPITISGLMNGQNYTFTVKAYNEAGYSVASLASIQVKPKTTPQPPTILSVSGADTQAIVRFSAPLNDGGDTITGYTVTSSPGGITVSGVSSPITVNGLTNGTSYRFTMTATNSVGTSTASTQSSSITPFGIVPTSAGQAAALAVAKPQADTSYITGYVQTSTKTAAQLFIELRAAKKATTTTIEKKNEITKAITTSIAAKAGTQFIYIPYNLLIATLDNIGTYIAPKPVTAILPDFSIQNVTPVVNITSAYVDTYIHIEAPSNSNFTLTDGVVSKTFRINLTGSKYVAEINEQNMEVKRFPLGSVIEVGSISKRIAGFGSILLIEPVVTVTLPITFTLSGVDAQILGQLFTMAGTKINVTEPLSVSSFYDPSGYSWIQYKQGVNEDDFTASVRDISAAIVVKDDMLNVLHISGGSVYDAANQGTSNLDCSAVFQGYQSKWTNFHNLQDFVLSYFANKVLGHPGALAAISNDSQIRTNVTQGFPAALNEMQTMGEDKLKSIVQQMMNQDLARFSEDDKNVFCPLKFRAGDKVIMRVVLADNTYSLNSPASNPSSVVGGVTVAQSASATTTSVNIGSNDSYLLVFTLA